MIHLLLDIILVGVALNCAYQLLILLYMRIYSKSYEYSRQQVNELFFDIAYHRDSIFLHNTDFPMLLFNDIKAYLKKEEFENWYQRFNMTSQPMESWNFNSGLPYYAVKLYVPNEQYKKNYETIVKTIAERILVNNHCSPLVLLDWRNPDSEYEWLEIRYARTQKETEMLHNTIARFEQTILRSSDISVKDINLEKVLSTIPEDK